MSLVSGEIGDQPRAWARAVKLAHENPDLLSAGDRIAVIGCGSSWHAAKSIAALRELSGRGEADAFAGSEAMLDRGYDRVVLISRSGATTEMRNALGAIGAGTPTTAIVGDPGSPVAAGCDRVVDLSFADDRAVVQTRFVTTVACLARASLGLDTAHLRADAETAIEAAHPIAPETVDRVTVLGTGWRVGLADAAALMLRESAQMWADSYPAMEYRHGPIATAGPGTLVWFIDPPPNGLAAEIAAAGAAVHEPELDPLAELVRIQRFALEKAAGSGIDVDNPPNLERAVVLDTADRAGAT
jgi:CRISPR-associated protein Cas5a/b/c